MHFVEGPRGAKTLSLDGYNFYSHHMGGDGRRYYRCNRGCNVSVVIADGEIVSHRGVHRPEHQLESNEIEKMEPIVKKRGRRSLITLVETDKVDPKKIVKKRGRRALSDET